MSDLKQQPGGFSGRITVDVTLRYLVYLPEEYGRKGQSWPLLLFLHGSGERGKDLELVKRHGPPKLIEEGTTFPFIVISPQCPEDEWWSVPALNALLDDLEQRFDVDRAREYATGMSMGGYATWKLGMMFAHRFAAIAPVCGGGDAVTVASLRNVPVWAFHGKKDRVVPVDRSESLVKALKDAGGNVRLTIYPDAEHDSWTKTYNNPELYRWLLGQKRRGP